MILLLLLEEESGGTSLEHGLTAPKEILTETIIEGGLRTVEGLQPLGIWIGDVGEGGRGREGEGGLV
jgi:hypothetical protein